MRIGRTGKIILGVLTAAAALGPLLLAAVVVLLAFALGFGAFGAAPNGTGPDAFSLVPVGIMFVVMPLQFVFIILSLGLQVFYFIHLLKNVAAAEIARTLLGLGFFFMPIIALPAYFLIYIWPPHPPNWAVAPGYETDDSVLPAPAA